MTSFSVSQLWRYPVKSMQGERLEAAELTAGGLRHDRGWAVRDEASGNIRGGKYFPELMHCGVRYLDGTDAGLVPHAAITLPDGRTVNTDDARVGQVLSDLLGKPVSLQPLQPADAEDHYRRRTPEADLSERDSRERLGLLDDEPMPKFNAEKPKVRAALNEYVAYNTPRGTYFDIWTLHLQTEASLRYLADLLPDAAVDVRRFRPNIVLADDGGLATPIEFDWVDGRLELGRVGLAVDAPCPRCVMATREQGDLPRASQIMRTLVRQTEQNLGVYVSVEREGRVAIDDSVSIG